MTRSRKIVLTLARVVIGFSLLYYLGTSGAIHWPSLRGMLEAWPLSLAALAVLVVDAGVIALRLKVLLSSAGFHLTLPAAYRLTQIGTFFNACLPGATGGDLIKLYYASEGNTGRRLEVAAIILIDRATGMFGYIVLAMLLAPFFTEMIAASAAIRAVLWTAAAVGVVMAAGTALAWSESVRKSNLVAWLLARMPLARYVERLYDAVYRFRHDKSAVLAAVALSVVAHMMAASVAMLASLAMFPQNFAWKMSLLIPLGFCANAVPFTPGGLGVGEAAFNKLFSLAGLKGGAEALLGWRLITIVMSLMGLFFYLQGRQRFVHDIEAMRKAETA